MNPVALYDVLNCAATALIAAEGGQHSIAEQAFLEASYATGDAFPLDSGESRALGVILGAVGAMVQGAAA
jgi:hypothetical protein